MLSKSEEKNELPRAKPKTNPKVMVASTGYVSARNTHEMCAERRLIALVQRQILTKHGVVTLLRMRRAISYVRIERVRSDSTFGCSLPCAVCREALERIDVCVECVVDNEWVRCRVSDLPVSSYLTYASKNELNVQKKFSKL